MGKRNKSTDSTKAEPKPTEKKIKKCKLESNDKACVINTNVFVQTPQRKLKAKNKKHGTIKSDVLVNEVIVKDNVEDSELVKLPCIENIKSKKKKAVPGTDGLIKRKITDEKSDTSNSIADVPSKVKTKNKKEEFTKNETETFTDSQPLQEDNIINKKTKAKKSELTPEDDVKDEDIDKFCDEVTEEDNKQYEHWIELLEAKLKSSSKKQK